MMFIYLILSVYINFTNSELAIKEQEYEYQQEYIRTIDNLIADFRRLRHNHTNTIYSIYGYIRQENYDGLKEYFGEIVDETKRISENVLLALQKIKVYPVFGLLWSKVNKAEALGISIDAEVSNDILKINVGLKDLCEVLGNYLDNAIEAAEKAENKKVFIGLMEEEEYITINISNTFSGELDKTMVYKKGYSTKGEGRGYGLSITDEILKRHNNIFHNTIVEEGYFTQELVINKKTNRKEIRKHKVS
jgi:two-component system sensor histidine kinase AgrC